MYPAEDGGQSWKREKAADELAANLYELVFTPGGLGFVLGNDGVLLRVRGGGRMGHVSDGGMAACVFSKLVPDAWACAATHAEVSLVEV